MASIDLLHSIVEDIDFPELDQWPSKEKLHAAVDELDALRQRVHRLREAIAGYEMIYDNLINQRELSPVTRKTAERFHAAVLDTLGPSYDFNTSGEQMSYDISLYDPVTEQPVEVEGFTEGGTYALGGSTSAQLNITYNYGEVYALVIPDYQGLKPLLHGKAAREMTPLLSDVVEKLGTRQYTDYWAPTPGNAGHAFALLLKWAQQHPDAVFDVD